MGIAGTDGRRRMKEDTKSSRRSILWRYENADIAVSYRARFIFYFCIVCLCTVLLTVFYSLYIQLNDPALMRVNYPVIATELSGAGVFVFILVLLVRGRFVIAANLMIIAGIAIVWSVMIFDRTNIVSRLDSIVYLFVILSMTSLAVHHRPAVLVIYFLVNIPVVIAYTLLTASELSIPDASVFDYIADVCIAIIVMCIVTWNIYRINTSSLDKLRDDISIREKTEEMLRQSREDLASVLRFRNEMLDTASVWIDTLDLDGNVVTWNRAAESISGYTKGEVAGHGRIWEWLYPDEDYRKKVYSRASDIINAGERVENFETVIRTRAGEERIISWNSNTLYDENGNSTGSIAIGSDITAQRREQEERGRLEEQLMQMQKMESIGRLAGGIAHDFNNLLTAILGSTELGMLHVKPGEKAYNNFTTIRKAAESAADLTKQLLAFSRKQIIEPRLLDLNDMMEQMRLMLERMIGENISLRVIPCSSVCWIKADRNQLEQIFINLAVNARDAMPDGGVLTLETSNVVLDEDYCRNHPHVKPGRYAMLCVSDSGRGISSEIRDHIFEPFYTTKEPGKGTGLGLATVYGAVKQNGGSIEFYSEEGHGTTFRIYLPCAAEDGSRTLPVNEQAEMPGGTETILVVEDNPLVLEFTGSALAGLGYNVITAVDGDDALKKADEYSGHIHMMMTDVILTGFNGKELAERIARVRPGIKILFSSGYSGDLITRSGVIDEGINFLGKPFSSYTLAKTVRNVLDNR